MNHLDRYDALVNRLVAKMKLSQTPVPGFILSLSGTDSTLAFNVVSEACARMGIPDRVMGIHYVHAERRAPTWFERDMVPVLREQHPNSTIHVATPLGGNHDPQRWADLHLRAINAVSTDGQGRTRIEPYDPDRRYWVAGSMNATEHELGTYTLLASAVSIQPIRSVWKTDVLSICEALGVPRIAIENARLPDCPCGRDELAALNIEVIDEIVRNRIDPTSHDPQLLKTLFEWIRDRKAENSFRTRIPYVV